MENDFIVNCKEKVFSEKILTFEETRKLLNTPDSELTILAKSADEITRRFNGLRVDVEELNNIKKNGCSEDCVFCAQSAFYDTKIERYQLPPASQIVKQAQKAKNDGAVSYCLVAAWREPSSDDFKKVCEIIKQINELVGIKVDCSLGFLTQDQQG